MVVNQFLAAEDPLVFGKSRRDFIGGNAEFSGAGKGGQGIVDIVGAADVDGEFLAFNGKLDPARGLLADFFQLVGQIRPLVAAVRAEEVTQVGIGNCVVVQDMLALRAEDPVSVDVSLEVILRFVLVSFKAKKDFWIRQVD